MKFSKSAQKRADRKAPLEQGKISRTPVTAYNLNGSDTNELLLVAKNKQYITPEGTVLVGVAWRGNLLLWDTKEEKPRPICAFKGQGVKELPENKHIKIAEKYIQAKIIEREEKMGRRIYG